LTLKNKQNETSLAVVRDVNNTVVALGGQAVAPESSAKCIGTKKPKWFMLMQRDYQNLKRNGVSNFLKYPITNKYWFIRQTLTTTNQKIFCCWIKQEMQKPLQLH
jgi:hypothetical protein